jgi:hypothetical protein
MILDRRVIVVDRTRKEIGDAADVTRVEMRTARSRDRLSGYYHGL